MQSKNRQAALALLLTFVCCSCQKNFSEETKQAKAATNVPSKKEARSETPNFNLEVILRGDANGFGLVKFRQDHGAGKIVVLDTWVRNLEPNHSYLLQRAVDTQIDGNCTGTTWLTLGRGLTPQAIETDGTGTGRTTLFRDLAAIPSGSEFDIHFQVIDAITKAVVLSSACYTYTVR